MNTNKIKEFFNFKFTSWSKFEIVVGNIYNVTKKARLTSCKKLDEIESIYVKPSESGNFVEIRFYKSDNEIYRSCIIGPNKAYYTCCGWDPNHRYYLPVNINTPGIFRGLFPQEKEVIMNIMAYIEKEGDK